MQSRYRPAGIAFIAVWFFLNGLSALGATFGPLFAVDLLSSIGLSGAAPMLGAVVALLIAVAYFAVGWGLWELRDWARLATIALAGLGLVSGLISGVLFLAGVTVFSIRLSFPGIGLGFIIVAVINGAVIWYLMKSDIQGLFTEMEGGSAWGSSSGFGFTGGGSTSTDLANTGVPTDWQSTARPPSGVPPSIVPTKPVASASSPVRPVDKTRPLYEPAPVAAWLVVRSGPRANSQLKLRAGDNIVGRDGKKSQLIVDEPSVSGQHAKVRFENGVFVIYDLASTNGTYINGRRVEKQRLMDNDLIRLGRMELVFKTVGHQKS